MDSILASDIPVKVVVIDNDSTDGTLELARRYAQENANVVAIPAGGNIGLSAGNNLVIPYIEGEYALMLNPDTIVKPDTLSVLIRCMEQDSSIGVVGPKCLYEDGSPHTSYHRGWNLWHLIVWRILPYSFTRKLYDKYARYRESDVDFVSGACLLVRASLFKKVEGYDPGYFLTVEDVCDLCRRIRRLGYRTLFTPRTDIKHLCGRSGAQVPFLTTLEGYKGDIYHFEKHHGKLGMCLAYAIAVLACSTKVLVSLSKVALRRREIDRKNLGVYWRILPTLLSRGPGIAHSTER
jgi:GT2 family glycosyltransferase